MANKYYNNLRLLRLESGLTMEQVARAVSFHFATISLYERCERDLSTEAIKKFCDFYHCSADYLLGRTNIRSAYVRSGDGWEFMNQFERLSKEQKELIKQMMNQMLSK